MPDDTENHVSPEQLTNIFPVGNKRIMMPMTIAAQNERAATRYVAPVRMQPQPVHTPQPKPMGATVETQSTHGVRVAEKEPGVVKDPTWKLQKLLDGKK